MVLEQIVVLMVDLGPDLVSTPFLAIELEILALSWAIFDALTHLISAFAWERFVV
jgi:hypothetical protein